MTCAIASRNLSLKSRQESKARKPGRRVALVATLRSEFDQLLLRFTEAEEVHIKCLEEMEQVHSAPDPERVQAREGDAVAWAGSALDSVVLVSARTAAKPHHTKEVSRVTASSALHAASS